MTMPSIDLPRAGMRSFGFQRETHKHNGIDLRAGLGAPIYAAAAGTVRHATDRWQQGFTGYGRVVVVEHADGTESLYAHLKHAETRKGARVSAGERIGLAGKTAFGGPSHDSETRGPHLHFEVSEHAYPMAQSTPRIDPVAWLELGNVHPVSGYPVTRGADAGPDDERPVVAVRPFEGGARSSDRSSRELPHCPSCSCVERGAAE